jgi:arylsulfatase A-like enzyme
MIGNTGLGPSRLVASALLLAAVAAPASLAAPPRPRPNILLILVDDLGYGDLGSYGAEDLRTPNIDALIARGMRFQNFYANCPVCSPSRAALLSGMDPDRVGVPGVIRTNPEDNWGSLSDRVALLPALLKRTGYHTALVGKWHLGLGLEDAPNARGFDRFHGFTVSSAT